jgi:hypothetical protein
LPCVADMVAICAVGGSVVVTTKSTEVAPSGTVTVCGTVANELSDDSDTVIPPDVAGPVSVTVPVVETPPNTEFG